MKALINILVLFLVACGSATLPDGTKIQGIGQDVAYEKTPDGTVRYVSTTSKSFIGATNNINTVVYSLDGATVATLTFTYASAGAADDDLVTKVVKS